MKQTVLITGASTGIGHATALAFANAGWQVVATMRTPQPFNHPNIMVVPLDVTNVASIDSAFAAAIHQFKTIDVVVNNAGYGVDGVFEAMSDEVIQKQFDTNVLGLMRVTRKAIEHMRPRKSGTIIQVASMGGLLTFPAYSIYHGTKWAVEGFSESLQYELLPLNIRVKIIEPGAIKTDFYSRSRTFVKPNHTNDYDAFIQKANQLSQDTGARGAAPEVVAKTILKAASSTSFKLRYVTGFPAPLLLWLRKVLPVAWFMAIVKLAYGIKKMK